MRQDKRGRQVFDQKSHSEEFAIKLEEHCDWFAAVPDSVISNVLARLKHCHYPPRENHAIGMAFGAKLAGRSPCVLMQNSGIGLCLDAILGTFHLYEQGLLIVVSNRGTLPWEEIQHQIWGQITKSMLESTGIFIIDFNSRGLAGIDEAEAMINSSKAVVALIVERGNLDEA